MLKFKKKFQENCIRVLKKCKQILEKFEVKVEKNCNEV